MRGFPTGCLIALTVALALCAVAASQDAPRALGPDVVMLRQLENEYEPVPFDHRGHAKMAEMWDGCVMCHHRSPLPTTKPASSLPSGPHMQDQSAAVPACKSCHERTVTQEAADLHMPGLKGAYHRQCLDCHRDWSHENDCHVCHKPREGGKKHEVEPTVDDVVGRMHPPIPEPDKKVFKMRFTPAAGGNVLFRHKEHTTTYGLKCAECHRRDSCSNCHDSKANLAGPRPVHPGRTWQESHEPCMSCHTRYGCGHCHYRDDQQPPAGFEHKVTGQLLDSDHVTLTCRQCHAVLRSKVSLSCGGSECHKGETIAYPARRPGPVISTQPATKPAVTTQPKRAPGTILRIRR